MGSCNFYYWGDDRPVEKPNVAGISHITRDQAENGQCRVDTNGRVAARNMRFFCYIGEIKEGWSDNATTPYEIYVAGRVSMWEDTDSEYGPI